MAKFEYIQKDIERYKLAYSVKKMTDNYRLFMSQSLFAVIVYRFGSWCINNSTVYKRFLKFFYIIINKLFLEIILGLYIPAACKIGKGLYIGGFRGLVVNSRVVIGDNCTIGHGVVLGTAGDGTSLAPVIGNNVYIGAGAVVIGGVTIGDNVKIGANAVVNKDIPSNVTAVGVPAEAVQRL